MGNLTRCLLPLFLLGTALSLPLNGCDTSADPEGALQCTTSNDCPPGCGCAGDSVVLTGVCRQNFDEDFMGDRCGGTCTRESTCPAGTQCRLDREEDELRVYACRASTNGTGGNGGTGGGGTSGSCQARLDFDLVCSGDVAVGEFGEVIVQGYDGDNINQLSFGAAGDGSIDPPAFQEPEFSDNTTTIPAPPYVFTFEGVVEGDAIVTVTTFDVSQDMCFVSKTCTFNVVE